MRRFIKEWKGDRMIEELSYTRSKPPPQQRCSSYISTKLGQRAGSPRSFPICLGWEGFGFSASLVLVQMALSHLDIVGIFCSQLLKMWKS